MELGFKSFVSEEQIEQKKRLRQEQWEQTRRPDQPLEAPPEEYDHRTLFERLKEQKDKKQEEYEESIKLKNFIGGMDDEDKEYLRKLNEHKYKEELKKIKEEESVLKEFQQQMANPNKLDQEKKNLETTLSSNPSSNSLSRQAKLIATGIKRKSEKKDEDVSEKRSKKDEGSSEKKEDKEKNNDEEKKNEEDKNKDDNNEDDDDKNKSEDKKVVIEDIEKHSALKVLGVLPGISSYFSDSSASDRSSDDNEDVNSTELDPFYVCSKARQIMSMRKLFIKKIQED